MVDKKSSHFGDLENRLNSDEKLRNEFFKDPVGVLTREDIKLTPQVAEAIKEQFDLLRTPKFQSLGIKPRIEITIKPIGIKIVIPIR